MKYHKYLQSLLFLSLLFGVAGCGTMKKTKTITTTQTILQLDTIIQFKHDTIQVVKEVLIHDTAMVENSTSKARSYYSPKKQKIVLTLVGKDIPIPVKMNVTKTETKKEVERVVTHRYRIPLLICVTLLLAFWGWLFIPSKKKGSK